MPTGSITDPAEQLGEYMTEGLFISHFDSEDFAKWQGYSQDTEVTILSGDPPEGYISSSNWHAKQITKWVLPTEGFQFGEGDVIFGDGAGHWINTVETSRVVISDVPNDWSD